jgi:hypothetical protein
MRGDNGEDERRRFLRRLQELFCSLDGGEADSAERRGGVPPGFGWTETEAAYQRTQAAWLCGRMRCGRRRREGLPGDDREDSSREERKEEE